MTRRQSSLEEHLIMKILCYAPLIFHIKELKNIRPNIRKILGHLYLYQILKIIGVYLQIRTFDYTHLGFQFSDFQLESFVDPKPVEL